MSRLVHVRTQKRKPKPGPNPKSDLKLKNRPNKARKLVKFRLKQDCPNPASQTVGFDMN